jgi:hypothetical protein
LTRFGSVKVRRVRSSRGLKRLLKGILPESDVYLVKPNWYSPMRGGYTDAAALETLLSALPGRAIVVEGYSGDRQDGSVIYRVHGEKVDWQWLLKNPDLGWILEDGNLEVMRSWDRWYRDSLGLTDVMERHGCEYLSVTEEILAGRAEDPHVVKKRVEERYPAVQYSRLYDYMPSRLAEYTGAPLISLGHLKGAGSTYPSLTIKNLFGLVPDPWRSWWHGKGDTRLSRSIIDIAKIYSSYFSLIGICEAFSCYTVTDPLGEVKLSWEAYRVEDGDGFVACGASLTDLDSVVCGLIGVDPSKVGYFKEAKDVFGGYDEDAVSEASACSRQWFPGV